jgi:hypothetical protein
MKVINADWEIKNLGKRTIEIICDEADLCEEIDERIRNPNCEYLVIKVPSSRPDLMQTMTRNEMHFIETTIKVTKSPDDLRIEKILERALSSVSYDCMCEDDLQVLYQQIESGLFTTDRIARDPVFGMRAATNRYVSWIQSELSRGTEVFKLVWKDKSVGFFTLKSIGDGVYYPFLAGIYQNEVRFPLGIATAYFPLREIASRKGRMIETFISTNNVSAVRMHVALGFTFSEICYAYVKHF